MSRRRGYDTTAPSKRTTGGRHPGGRHEIMRPEFRQALRHLAEVMRLTGHPQLADVCERGLAGHGPEQIRATQAILMAVKYLLPEWPKGTEP